MKNKDPQQIALEKAVSDFWDTTDVPQEPSPVKIASYPSLEIWVRARPKDSSNRVSAFQDYTSAMMSALNNPWKSRSKRTATSTWTAVPPLVFLSASGTPVGDAQTKKRVG